MTKNKKNSALIAEIQARRNKKIDAFVNKLGLMMQCTPFSIEFKVKKKPQGIKIIFEVSQEEMDVLKAHQK